MPATNADITNTTPVPETQEEDPLLNEKLNSDDDDSDAEHEDPHGLEVSSNSDEEDPDNDSIESDSESDKEDEEETLRVNVRKTRIIEDLLQMVVGHREVMGALGNNGEIEAADKIIKMCKDYLERADTIFEKARIILNSLEKAKNTPKKPKAKRAQKKPMSPECLPSQVEGMDLPEEVKEALLHFRAGNLTDEDIEFLSVFFSGLVDELKATGLDPTKSNDMWEEARGNKTRPAFDDETQGLHNFVKFLGQCLLLASKHYGAAKKKANLPEGADEVVVLITKVINIMALTHGLNPKDVCRRMPTEKQVCGSTTAVTKEARLLSFLRFCLDGSVGITFTKKVKTAIAKAIEDLQKPKDEDEE